MEGAGRLPRIWSPVAAQDLLHTWTYACTAASSETADQQLREIERVCFALGAWPEFGKARDEVRKGLRSVRAGRYVIFYRVVTDALEIIRVLDERRDVDTIFLDEE
jgi:toxin ParE1/3/4